jgi:hypothetical protein
MHYLMERLEGAFLMVCAGPLFSGRMKGKAQQTAFFVVGFILRRNYFGDGKTDNKLIDRR